MFFTFCEQKIDILNLKNSPDSLFMTAKFYRMLWIFSYVAHMLGHGLSHDFTEFLKYVKYITWILWIQNLWPKDIVERILTAFCLFLCSDKTYEEYLTCRQHLTSCNIGIILNIAWNSYFFVISVKLVYSTSHL